MNSFHKLKFLLSQMYQGNHTYIIDNRSWRSKNLSTVLKESLSTIEIHFFSKIPSLYWISAFSSKPIITDGLFYRYIPEISTYFVHGELSIRFATFALKFIITFPQVLSRGKQLNDNAGPSCRKLGRARRKNLTAECEHFTRKHASNLRV